MLLQPFEEKVLYTYAHDWRAYNKLWAMIIEYRNI